MEVLNENPGDCVNAIMAREPLLSQARHRPHDGRMLHRDLILDDGVERRMCLDVGELDVGCLVMRLDKDHT